MDDQGNEDRTFKSHIYGIGLCSYGYAFDHYWYKVDQADARRDRTLRGAITPVDDTITCSKVSQEGIPSFQDVSRCRFTHTSPYVPRPDRKLQNMITWLRRDHKFQDVPRHDRRIEDTSPRVKGHRQNTGCNPTSMGRRRSGSPRCDHHDDHVSPEVISQTIRIAPIRPSYDDQDRTMRSSCYD